MPTSIDIYVLISLWPASSRSRTVNNGIRVRQSPNGDRIAYIASQSILATMKGSRHYLPARLPKSTRYLPPQIAMSDQ